MNQNELITNAEKQISRILENLEAQSGAVVDSINLRDIEVTTFVDDSPQWMRSVVIELKRLPGTSWL